MSTAVFDYSARLASTLWFPVDGRDPTTTRDIPVTGPGGTDWNIHSVSAAIARGKRPVTFRTRKLRLSAPMVLQGGPCGRVGHRRTSSKDEAILVQDGLVVVSGPRSSGRLVSGKDTVRRGG